jgi:hypothetical protein
MRKKDVSIKRRKQCDCLIINQIKEFPFPRTQFQRFQQLHCLVHKKSSPVIEHSKREIHWIMNVIFWHEWKGKKTWRHSLNRKYNWRELQLAFLYHISIKCIMCWYKALYYVDNDRKWCGKFTRQLRLDKKNLVASKFILHFNKK